jgi:hypothetical protein
MVVKLFNPYQLSLLFLFSSMRAGIARKWRVNAWQVFGGAARRLPGLRRGAAACYM